MKKLALLGICLFWATIGFGQHRHHNHQHQHRHQHQAKKQHDFYQQGERMFGLNHLSLGYAPASQQNSQHLVSFGLGIQAGRFIRDQLMFGTRLQYNAHYGFPSPGRDNQSRFYETHLFLRRYRGQGRLQFFSEFGGGASAQRITNVDRSIELDSWTDWFVESQAGLALRLGRKLGMELSGGVRLGTLNAPRGNTGNSNADFVWNWGLNYYFR